MKSCLIVYYSRTGVTARVATALSKACGADLQRIQDRHPRAGVTGYLRSAWQALRGQRAGTAPALRHPGDYACVVLGTPVREGRMSAPMRNYIMQQRDNFRSIGLFCTEGGSGGLHVLTAMAELCNKRPLASMSLSQGEVLAGAHLAMLAGFAAELAVLSESEPG